ncbi:DUF3971 domain-containing protein [Muricoccus radiodurans]|uniref:YhdP family protein n=1 Tax=Muricoccus radiodurans TaxID=2231721 RepID=UPI003CF25ACC
MRRLGGQGGRSLAWLFSALLRLVMVVFIVAAVGVTALAWRLSEGPLSLAPVTKALESWARSRAPGLDLRIGEASVAWAGWHDGAPQPVTIRLNGLRAHDAAGSVRAALTSAEVSLSVPRLLRFQVAPTRIVLRDPLAVLRRDAEGALSLDLGDPSQAEAPTDGEPEAGPDLLESLLHAPDPDSPLSLLEQVVVTEGIVQIRDEPLGFSWSLQRVGVALRREASGDAVLDGSAGLALGGQAIPVRLSGRITGRPAVAEAALEITEVGTTALANALPVLRPLAVLDTVAGARFEGRYAFADQSFSGRATITAGPGRYAGAQSIGFRGVDLLITADERRVSLERAALSLPPGQPGFPSPSITATGSATRTGDLWRGRVEIGLDRMAMPDLALYWPPGVAEGGRRWVTENITAGTARDGRWWVEAEAPADFSAPRLLDAGGQVQGENLTVHWLRPIPPLEGAQGTVTFTPRDITIRAGGARQSGTALVVPQATIRLYDLDRPPEKGDIQARITGPLADVLTVVRHPRLHLFDRRPLDLKEPGGSVEANLSINLPLINDLPMDQLRLSVEGRIANGRVADLVAGQPLERANLDVSLDPNGMRLTGSANLGPIPASRVQAELDFRSGAPSQVTERVRVEGRADAGTLRALRVDAAPYLRGPLGYVVQAERRRSGETQITARANLRDARIELAPLAYSKPAGAPASVEGILRLQGDSLRALEEVRIEGPNLMVRGGLSFGTGDRLNRADVLEARIGATRVTGAVVAPDRPDAAYQIQVRGPMLDARSLLREMREERSSPPNRREERSTPLRLDVGFERVLLAEGRELAPVMATAFVDANGVLRELRASGRGAAGGGFDAAVVPRGAGRAMEVASNEFGTLLRGLGLMDEIDGGRLRIVGSWPSNAPGAPLSALAELTEFGVREGQTIGKLLQALTVYGIVDALRGPGVRFDRLYVPFTLTEEAVTLTDAQAFSSSLGLTARGRILRRTDRLDMQGTVVPAYMFNSLLGRIPGIGRLFSAEAGGGLFAVSFRLTGPLDDPSISVNPLSALTPGALRGLFSALEGPPATPAPAR